MLSFGLCLRLTGYLLVAQRVRGRWIRDAAGVVALEPADIFRAQESRGLWGSWRDLGKIARRRTSLRLTSTKAWLLLPFNPRWSRIPSPAAVGDTSSVRQISSSSPPEAASLVREVLQADPVLREIERLLW